MQVAIRKAKEKNIDILQEILTSNTYDDEYKFEAKNSYVLDRDLQLTDDMFTRLEAISKEKGANDLNEVITRLLQGYKKQIAEGSKKAPSKKKKAIDINHQNDDHLMQRNFSCFNNGVIMEITYANNEYRKDVLEFIKENYKDRKYQAFGATVFTYFISVLKEYGENTDKFETIEIDTVNVRYGVIVFSGKDDVVKLKRYSDTELKDNIWMMRSCRLEQLS